MGDSTFSWCTDDQLETLDSSNESRQKLQEFQAYGARQRAGSVVALQVARALHELGTLEQGAAEAVPWPVGSPSSGEDAADDDGGAGGAGRKNSRL